MSERCPHSKFKYDIKMKWVDVTGLARGSKPLRQLFSTLKLVCTMCNEPFVFRGEAGVSTMGPSVSPDGFELRCPIEYPIIVEDDEDVTPTVH